MPTLSHEVTIRYRRDLVIRPADVFLFGGRYFDIQAVVNVDEANEAFKLFCIERQP